MPIVQSRRPFLTDFGIAGAAGLGAISAAGLGGARKSFAAEPPPETTTIRLEKDPVPCFAPLTFEDLLRAEGFTDIRFVELTTEQMRRAAEANTGSIADMIARGEVDFGRDFAPGHVLAAEGGGSITILAGLHLGCFEVFAKDDIHNIADLKGRAVGYAGGDLPLLTIMVSLIGLNPARDIRWVPSVSSAELVELFTKGQIDAFLASACFARGTRQEYRACHRELDRRPPVVAILLLHGEHADGICAQISRCDQTSAACHSQRR